MCHLRTCVHRVCGVPPQPYDTAPEGEEDEYPEVLFYEFKAGKTHKNYYLDGGIQRRKINYNLGEPDTAQQMPISWEVLGTNDAVRRRRRR